MKRCKNCLLPAAVPNAQINAAGYCAFCRDPATLRQEEEALRAERERDLEAALEDCRGKAEYDCLVNLSGGKDSCYLLYKLKEEYKLNVLAFTVIGNIPELALRNVRRTVERLQVPHITYTPPREFYRKLYRFLLQHQEPRGAVRTVCYVCAPLYETYALRLALEKRIPLILAGYSPGQPSPDRMVYELPQTIIAQTDWTPPLVRASGLFTQRELAMFWNPFVYPPGTRFPRLLAPFHAWKYDQQEVMRAVVQLGLIASSRMASPVWTNCALNWLLMYSDLRNLGYNPYAPEFAALIRQGKASRWYWRLFGPLVDFMIRHQVFLGRQVTPCLDWLGLQPEDLHVEQRASDSTDLRQPPPPMPPIDWHHPAAAEPDAQEMAQ
jgi:hypothetical protein